MKERFPESIAVSGERREIARREYTMRRRVLAIFRDGPKTIPEAAAALGVPTHQATWWIMGYVRFGQLAATEEVTDDGYYRYRLAEGKV